MIDKLPALNAFLNGTSTVLILTGYYLIKKKNQTGHRFAMGGALFTSSLFLVSYGYYHFNKIAITTFRGTGIARTVYLTILGTHSVLALIIVPMIFITVARALRGDHERHKKIARITFPVWLYVSFTGVIIYLLLYQVY